MKLLLLVPFLLLATAGAEGKPTDATIRAKLTKVSTLKSSEWFYVEQHFYAVFPTLDKPEKKALLLLALEKLNALIDPAFDINDAPQPPAGPKGFDPRMEPERISDPKVRHKYIADNTAFYKQRDAFNEQRRSATFRDRLVSDWNFYFGEKATTDQAELRAQLSNLRKLDDAAVWKLGTSLTSTFYYLGDGEKKALLLFGVRCVEDARDPAYDPHQEVYMNMVPPGGRYPSGIAPEAIEEPDIRVQDILALAENGRRGERSSRHHALVRLRDGLIREGERHLGEKTVKELLKE